MKEQLKQGIDFYFDANGLMVLTEAYHLKKGVCCGHGCRHCPYQYTNVPENRKNEILASKLNREEKR